MQTNAFLLSGSLATVACSRAPSTNACAIDRTTVLELLKMDEAASAMLHRADALVTQGQAAACASLIESAVLPVLDRAIDNAKRAPVTTSWGQARRTELVVLMEQRRDGASRYVQALYSDQVSEVVEQMQAQRDIERRAVEVEEKVQKNANDATSCAP